MKFDTDPIFSRRRFLSVAILAAGAAVSGCTDSATTNTALSQNELSNDHRAIIGGVQYQTRAVAPSQDPLFRAVTASIFLRGINATSVGAAFIYKDGDDEHRVGTVEHVLLGDGMTDLRAAGMFVSGMSAKLLPLPLPLHYDPIGVVRRDNMAQLFVPQNTKDQINRLVQDGVIHPVELAQHSPIAGDVLLLPQLGRGVFERIIAGGQVSDQHGESRTITVQERVLDVLGSEVPKDIDELNELEQRIMSGEGNIAQDLGSFVCSGDSGTPLLTESTQQVCGVVQSLAISTENSIGQLCGPLVYIS